MTSTNKPVKYFPKVNRRKQLPMLWPIIVMFVLTIIYASGLRNHTVRISLYCLSLVYPAVLLFALASTIPRQNYMQLDADGINMTIYRFFHRTIRFSDVKRIKRIQAWGIDGLGIEYKSSVNRNSWFIKNRRKLTGWDDFVPDAYSENGTPMTDEFTRLFRSYSG